MGLSCHFEIGASADKTPADLEEFLKIVETEAQRLGFKPTLVLNVPFDTPERRLFARRLTTGQLLQSDKLKGVVVLGDGQVFSHDTTRGECRLIPERGVVLVVTETQGHETIFGFLRYPAMLKDMNGREVVETGLGREWAFRDFFNSPDQRFRGLLQRFAEAGYLKKLVDEHQTRCV